MKNNLSSRHLRDEFPMRGLVIWLDTLISAHYCTSKEIGMPLNVQYGKGVHTIINLPAQEI